MLIMLLNADRLELAEADVYVLLHLHLLLIQVVILGPTDDILTVLGSEFENAIALDAEGTPFPVLTCATEETTLS